MTSDDIINLEEREREQAFLEMPEPDKWKVIFSMLAYLRKKIPTMEKEQIEFREELREVRRMREKREVKSQTTQEKIEAILLKRFDFWIWFRDKVLPSLLSLGVIALLYLIFGGKP